VPFVALGHSVRGVVMARDSVRDSRARNARLPAHRAEPAVRWLGRLDRQFDARPAAPAEPVGRPPERPQPALWRCSNERGRRVLWADAALGLAGYASLIRADESNALACLRSSVAPRPPRSSASSVTVRSSTTTRRSARHNAGSSQARIDWAGQNDGRSSMGEPRWPRSPLVQGDRGHRREQAPSHQAPPRGWLRVEVASR
jgi:hypothetical protein